ncbi:hypothetical protein Fmac_013704 [Flemingia macrophylla]|uniref:Uncharacterized protein n=1 Tax=Flemingia macrophylla TaxID=520843 RepID=A0ABD1MUV8_9FABA
MAGRNNAATESNSQRAQGETSGHNPTGSQPGDPSTLPYTFQYITSYKKEHHNHHTPSKRTLTMNEDCGSSSNRPLKPLHKQSNTSYKFKTSA